MGFLEFSRRRRRWLLLAATAGISGYGAYKLYHLPSVARKRRKLARLVGMLVAVASSASSSAETVALVSSDLNRFLRSDTDEIPTSLKQISKIAHSDEFSGSLSRVSEALTVGISRGFQSSAVPSESVSSSSFSDRFLDKLLSTAGSGFASVVAGSFARSLVMAFSSRGTDGGEVGRTQSDSPAVPRWVHVICSDKCREMIGDCIQLFVSTAVAVYLDKTMDINPYDEIFSGLTNPKHEAKVKDMLTSVCNGAVETLVKTSHQVLTSSNSGSSVNRIQDFVREEENERKISFDHKSEDGGGWVQQVSSTLAVPSNRRFVLDVTGRVTFETVRSFLDFVLWRLYEGARRGVNAVSEEVVARGLEVLRFISAKSMVIVTICLTLCLHVLTGMTVLMPA
ncbi:protein PHLOEM PROTEIN 2-LIKE A10 [Cocos nucifera]|nr:protein PHLOEM PROTEIN 2-LIKE A10 [Cocos nucifera]